MLYYSVLPYYSAVLSRSIWFMMGSLLGTLGVFQWLCKFCNDVGCSHHIIVQSTAMLAWSSVCVYVCILFISEVLHRYYNDLLVVIPTCVICLCDFLIIMYYSNRTAPVRTFKLYSTLACTNNLCNIFRHVLWRKLPACEVYLYCGQRDLYLWEVQLWEARCSHI